MDERQRDEGPDDHEVTVPDEALPRPDAEPEVADAASAPAAQPRDGGHDLQT